MGKPPFTTTVSMSGVDIMIMGTPRRRTGYCEQGQWPWSTATAKGMTLGSIGTAQRTKDGVVLGVLRTIVDYVYRMTELFFVLIRFELCRK